MAPAMPALNTKGSWTVSDHNNEDRTLEPSDGDFQPVEDQPPTIATGGEPADELGPEIGPEGTDPESNVTGRSKPASDGVANEEHQEDGDRG